MPFTTLYIVYDSIANPVFESQVLIPLQKRSPNKKKVVISFEYKTTQIAIKKLQQRYPDITFILLKKYRYWCRLSLLPALWRLRSALKSFNNYEIITRGPFATLVALKAINPACVHRMVIQVRGLVAAEYEYTTVTHKKSISFFLHKLRAYQLLRLEKKSLHSIPKNVDYSIEVVSSALSDYLIKVLLLPSKKIVIASYDTPLPLSNEQKIEARKQIRTLYNIPEHAYVYCYNGSAKPWQCPTETIGFFKEQLIKNPNSFLMIISNDIEFFKQQIDQYNIPPHTVLLTHVPHHEVMTHLAACDAGIIFREPHLMNWVSRPTKALEYQAAGLSIIHNHTIAFLK